MRAELFLHFLILQFARRPGRGNDSRQPEQRDQIRLGFDVEFPPQPLDGFQIGLGHVAIDFHGGGPGWLVIDVHIHMAAPQTVANRLPDARFEHFKSVRHSQMEIQKPVIHAAQIDSQNAAIAFGARLREARHRMNPGPRRGSFHPSAPCPGLEARPMVGVAMSSVSANCIS